MKGFPDLPPIWLAGFCIAAWLLAWQLPLVMAFGPVFRLTGLALVAAGLAVIAWSALWFLK